MPPTVGTDASRRKNLVDTAPRAEAETRGGNRNTIYRSTACDIETRRRKCTTKKKDGLYFVKINGERRIMGFKSMSSRCTVNMKYSYVQSTRDWKT